MRQPFRSSWSLGRARGAQLRVHAVVAVAWVLYLVTAATVWLPAAAPSAPGWRSWSTALLLGVVVAASFAAREAARVAAAVAEGGPVETATWYPWGARWTRADVDRTPEPNTQHSLVLQFAVGPAASLVLAWVGQLTKAGVGAGMLSAALSVFVWTHVVFAAASLVPVRPFDGAGLLEGLIARRPSWGAKRARTRCTLVALAVLPLGALVALAGGHVAAALWIGALGAIALWSVATGQGRLDIDEPASASLVVGDVMSSPVVTLPAAMTIAECVERARRYPVSTFVIVDAGTVVGLVRREAWLRLPEQRWTTMPVRAVAASFANVAVVGPDDALSVAADAMQRAAGHRALVFDGVRLVGIVAPSDVLGALAGLARPDEASGAAPDELRDASAAGLARRVA